MEVEFEQLVKSSKIEGVGYICTYMYIGRCVHLSALCETHAFSQCHLIYPTRLSV